MRVEEVSVDKRRRRESDILIVDSGLVWKTSNPVTKGENQAWGHSLLFSLPLFAQRSCQAEPCYTSESLLSQTGPPYYLWYRHHQKTSPVGRGAS